MRGTYHWFNERYRWTTKGNKGGGSGVIDYTRLKGGDSEQFGDEPNTKLHISLS